MRRSLNLPHSSPKSSEKKKHTTKSSKHKQASSLATPRPSFMKIHFTDKQSSKINTSPFASPSSCLKPTPSHRKTISTSIPITSKHSESIFKRFSPEPVLWKNAILPLTPKQCLQDFSIYLSNYERKEILDFNKIYYIAHTITKVKSSIGCNSGFDDDNSDYKILKNDHIKYRYEIKATLGKGSFGQVVKVVDHKSKKEFAIKIIKNKARFFQQAIEEIEVLDFLQSRDSGNHCIVKKIDNFVFRKHMCIVFELLSVDLYEFIKLTNFQGLSQSIIKQLAVQMLKALSFCDHYQVLHCDLKPENILLTSSTETSIKVIDFGSACFYEKRMYTYIQSRFYRAPEIILGLSYSTSIDMWSFGCILVELYTGHPVFPGEDETDQIQRIIEVLGVPEVALLRKASRFRLFFNEDYEPRSVISPHGKQRVPGSKKLSDILLGAEEGLINLISKCLRWNQSERLTPDEALSLEWLKVQSQPKRRLKHTRNNSNSIFIKFPDKFDKH